ncbi:MAG: LysM peptidoglycan-binding domain-containing protein [Verrucomicrobia bacterium]|nr:LysM peptidoglycan-binding domain-containing protein [Verrucomicrobiota bacterium]MDA0858493.1 LysM peptidoglycan-binding domain-containing protein [Verrucomicrobiota bacterium]MDA1340172.1 LysM peptidoglycan-binding domain-containing protein [Verrucomicrobiota bacterium]
MRVSPIVAPILLLLATTISNYAAPTHTVQKGETFYQIAKQHAVSPDALAQANPTIQPTRLHPGDILRLPSATVSTPASSPVPSTPTRPLSVKIQKGDTLSKISRQHGVSLKDLRRWNRLNGSPLQIGQTLRLSAPLTAAPLAKPTAPALTLPTPPKISFVAPVRKQIDSPRGRLRRWEYIVVHHSGTGGGNARIFDAYHKERGMENGMAYHFVIGNGSDSGDGQIEVGSRWTRQIQGGHVASDSLNEIAIGICLVGDFSHHQPDPRQKAALIELVRFLRQLQSSPRLKFRLHREINTKPTECPGKLFPSAKLHEILD